MDENKISKELKIEYGCRWNKLSVPLINSENFEDLIWTFPLVMIADGERYVLVESLNILRRKLIF